MTKYIYGDVVKTKWGNAVITEVEPDFDHERVARHSWNEVDEDYPTTYAVDHLPGYIERIWEDGIGLTPKYAWYSEDELEMVEPSAARNVMKAQL